MASAGCAESLSVAAGPPGIHHTAARIPIGCVAATANVVISAAQRSRAGQGRHQSRSEWTTISCANRGSAGTGAWWRRKLTVLISAQRQLIDPPRFRRLNTSPEISATSRQCRARRGGPAPGREMWTPLKGQTAPGRVARRRPAGGAHSIRHSAQSGTKARPLPFTPVTLN